MKILVGNTGLVGKSISEQEHFDYFFNSKNINEFTNIAKNGDELFLCCLPATKWLVNKNPEEDIQNINSIHDILSSFEYSKITLISTIDVYNYSPLKSDEGNLKYRYLNQNYGNNRRYFELLIFSDMVCDNLKIFRLPALFNKHIKKNILFDLINENNINLINVNSSYQWYNLDNLSKDIKFFSEKYPENITFNLFTEPIDTKEIIDLFPQHKDKVSFLENRIEYDYTTKFSPTGYIENKESVLDDIKNFINEFSIK